MLSFYFEGSNILVSFLILAQVIINMLVTDILQFMFSDFVITNSKTETAFFPHHT